MNDLATAPTLATPDRIAAKALALFNEFGFERVPVHRIAADLGMSPGNLTYHFSRKQDLLDRLVQDFADRFHAVLSTPSADSPEDMAAYWSRLFALIWEYRFFFKSFEYLIQDSATADIHRGITEHAISLTASQMDFAIASRRMRPLRDPGSTRLLAETMWANWLEAICFAPMLSDAPPKEQGNAAIHRAMLRQMMLIQPYSSKAFIKELKALIDGG